MNRRELLKIGAFTVLTSCTTNVGQNSKLDRVGLHTEGKVVNKEYDVIVCGGGPAGVAAAVSAARAGAKTCLIELYGCLGGILTSGMICNIIDSHSKTGIMAEIMEKVKNNNSQLQPQIYDSEAMKLILEQMCFEAGVHIRLYTRIVSSIVEKTKLKAVITESNSGREIWNAKCFIDTTGNGDLAAYSGCNYDLGHPENGKCQPLSLMGLVMGVKKEDLANVFLTGNASNPENKINLRKEIEKSGISPSYGIPTLFAIRPDLFALMANHEYGVSAINAEQLSEATLRARVEVNRIVDGLRSLGGIWKNIRLITTGTQIGIREGRRIKGYYQITREDIIKGVEFEDGVCQVTYMADIHSLEHNKDGYTTDGITVKPYKIPLRSLIAKDVNGLMMAGRCICGDFFAHASYRVVGNAVAMGEVAGIVSAIASKTNRMPHEVTWSESTAKINNKSL